MPSPHEGFCLSTFQSISQSSFKDDGERNEALLAAYALVSRLETPWETVCRLTMAQVKTPPVSLSVKLALLRTNPQPALNASLKVLKDLNLFERWHEHGDIAMTSDELAELVPCDAMLLRESSPSGELKWGKLECFFGMFRLKVG